MARLWRNDPATPGGCKYLVKRRDGTIPEWPWFVLGARDKYAPAALRRYADEAEAGGEDPAYVADIRAMADEWETVRATLGDGDPAASRHRQDDPATVAEMVTGKSRTEHDQLLAMLDRAGTGYGRRTDHNPPGEAVQIETGESETDFMVTEFVFDGAGKLKEVTCSEGEAG